MNKPDSRIPWDFLVPLLAVAFLLGYYLLLIPLNDDAGFFLPHASLMMDGQLPYQDFFTWHSPWGPLLLIPLTWLSPENLLAGFSWYMLAWNLLSAGLIYLISRRHQVPGWISIVFSGWFLGMAIPTAGYYVTLEPLYLPFLLGAYLLISGQNRRKWLIAGLLIGLALCVKQFALIGCVMLLLPAFRQQRWKQYLSGVMLPVLLSIGLLMLGGVSGEAIWNHWFSPESPSAYFSPPENLVLILIILLPAMILGIGSASTGVKDIWAKIGIIAGFAGLWSLSGNDQYLLPAIAFLAIIHGPHVKRSLILISLALVAASAGVLTMGQMMGLMRETQLTRAEETIELVSEEESILIIGWSGQYVYALIPQQAPAMSTAGYQVFPLMTGLQKETAIDESDVIMVLDCDHASDPDTSRFELILSQDRGCRRWFRRNSPIR